jgi:multiple sugar transport system substrate-binding protein
MTRKTRGPLVLLVLLLAFALAAFAAGCGGGDDEAADENGGTSTTGAPRQIEEPTSPVTISFSSWVGNEPNIKKIAKAFQKEHPNITIKFQNVPAEQAAQKLTTQIAGGNPPDTVYLDSGTIADFAERDALANLDRYIERSDLVDPADFVEPFRATTEFDGSMFALPFDGESTGLFYRTDLF